VRLLLLLLLCGVLVAGHFAYRRHQADEAIRAAVEELDRTDPGWRLQDIEAARTVVPDAENSALVVRAAYQLIPRDWPPSELAVRCTDLSPQLRLDEDTTEWLFDELCQSQDALLEAHKLSALPDGRHPITYKRDILQTLLPHADQTRKVLALLRLDVVAQTQRGDLKKALPSCRALLNAGRSLGDEPLMVTQIVRTVAVGSTCHALQRVLAQGAPDPEDLLQMQRLLEAEERFPRLLVAVRGERATFHELFDAVESGDVRPGEVAGSPRSWSDSLGDFAARDYFRAQHPGSLAAFTEMIDIAALPPHERGAPWQALEAKLLRQRNIMLGLLAPAIAKMDEATQRTEGHLRCAIAALAAERFRHRHGHLPDTLEQLVPDFLPAVPLDPKDSQPLGYQHLPDRVVIYSLCRGPSKSGTPAIYDPDEPSRPGEGVAFHLFEVQHRRQPPPELAPMPAIVIEAP
jgi:hypothetical protein